MDGIRNRTCRPKMNLSCEFNGTAAVSSLLSPNDDHWKVRSPTWYATFNVLVVFFCLLYTTLALSTLTSLCCGNSATRFRKARTFIAIDLALLILGASRAAFLILDPWGQNDFITCKGCILMNRIINALAFPSLTASYTLVFITLWVSAKIHLRSSAIQKIKVIIPICFGHYVIALTAEIIAASSLQPLAAIALIITCEAIFSLWGIAVCTSFIVAGIRLLHVINHSARSSSMVCRDTPQLTRHDLISSTQIKELRVVRYGQKARSKASNEAQQKHHRTVAKITRITYLTAGFGILYSSLVLINLIFICLNLFHECPGEINGSKLSPERWLILHFSQLLVELLLAGLLSYCNTDHHQFIAMFKKKLSCSVRSTRYDN